MKNIGRGDLAAVRAALQHERDCMEAAKAEISRLSTELAAKQAQIDLLMLEFCPDEMTDEQRAEWAANQVQQKSISDT